MFRRPRYTADEMRVLLVVPWERASSEWKVRPSPSESLKDKFKRRMQESGGKIKVTDFCREEGYKSTSSLYRLFEKGEMKALREQYDMTRSMERLHEAPRGEDGKFMRRLYKTSLEEMADYETVAPKAEVPEEGLVGEQDYVGEEVAVSGDVAVAA